MPPMAGDKRTVIVGVPTETFPGEQRVAMVPATVPTLDKAGFHVVVQRGAGEAAGFPDAEYEAKGARLVPTAEDLFREADVVLTVRSFSGHAGHVPAALGLLREGQAVVGMLDPLAAAAGVQKVAATGITAFALELLPRITRAQSMDVLSSMATISGYKAVLLGASTLPRLFPMLMTAAGTISPAKVLVIGAGVAGLQAIATSRRLGAVVEAYDVRDAAKEQVLSLGAKFVDLAVEAKGAEDAGGYAKAQDESFYQRQREAMARVVAGCDVVICTAAVPGRKAPVLVTTEAVDGMRRGSVVVDLAAEQGGNCELTRAGESVDHQGVHVLGPVNLAAQVPNHASQLYAKNLATFLLHAYKDGEIKSESDEILSGTLVCRGGEVVHSRVREALGLPVAQPVAS
jgi:H+-translocating NAD(P) transhydrogenase subunit alpha